MIYRLKKTTLQRDFGERFRSSTIVCLLVMLTLGVFYKPGARYATVEIVVGVFAVLLWGGYNLVFWLRSRRPGSVTVCDNGDVILPSQILPGRERRVPAEDVYLTRLVSRPTGPNSLYIHVHHSSPRLFFSNHFEDVNALERISEEIGKGNPEPRHLPFPWVAIALCVAVTVVFAATHYSANFVDAATLVKFGAWHKDLFATGEIYRFISHAFLHLDFFHLGVNVLMLVITGYAVEHVWGHARWLSIFVLGAVVGSLGMYLSDQQFLIGASGGAYGVFGAYLYLRLLRNRQYEERLRPLSTSALLFIVMLDVVISSVSRDAAVTVHVAALFTGGLYALVMDRTGLSPRVGRVVDGVFTAVAGLLAVQSLYMALTWNDARSRRLASHWLDAPEYSDYADTAARMLAVGRQTEPSLVDRAIERISGMDSPGVKDTLATLYARSGDFERAVSIENAVLRTTPDALFATQLARFERRYEALRVGYSVDGDTLGVEAPSTIDMICGTTFRRFPVEREVRLSSVCNGKPEILAARPGVAGNSIKLRLDDRVLALPLD